MWNQQKYTHEQLFWSFFVNIWAMDQFEKLKSIRSNIKFLLSIHFHYDWKKSQSSNLMFSHFHQWMLYSMFHSIVKYWNHELSRKSDSLQQNWLILFNLISSSKNRRQDKSTDAKMNYILWFRYLLEEYVTYYGSDLLDLIILTEIKSHRLHTQWYGICMYGMTRQNKKTIIFLRLLGYQKRSHHLIWQFT